MKGSIAALLAGWALLTAGVAALTTPWAWALSAGLLLASYGAVGMLAAVRERQETMAQEPPPAAGGAR